jgi:hypothetical protein
MSYSRRRSTGASALPRVLVMHSSEIFRRPRPPTHYKRRSVSLGSASKVTTTAPNSSLSPVDENDLAPGRSNDHLPAGDSHWPSVLEAQRIRARTEEKLEIILLGMDRVIKAREEGARMLKAPNSVGLP